MKATINSSSFTRQSFGNAPFVKFRHTFPPLQLWYVNEVCMQHEMMCYITLYVGVLSQCISLPQYMHTIYT